MSEGKEDQMQKLRLNAEITAAIAESKLPWPEYGYVVAAALTNIVGNPITLCLREGGSVLEFDSGGRYKGRRETPAGWAMTFLAAVPGETIEARLSCALDALQVAADMHGLRVEIGCRNADTDD